MAEVCVHFKLLAASQWQKEIFIQSYLFLTVPKEHPVAVKSSDCTIQQIRNLGRSNLNFVTFKNALLILKLEYLGFKSKLRGRFIHFSTQNSIC